MSTETTPLRALIYTRVSQDRAGLSRSVGEQETECRAECNRRGWTVASVITENDRSASQYAKKGRPEWAKVKAELSAGRVDVLVTWEASRSSRDLGEFVRLRDLCKASGTLLSYSGRVLDLATSTDAFLGGLDALLAERESGQSSERIRRATRAAAAKGRPHGRRTYGYRRTYDETTGNMIGQVPDELEALVVVEIVTRVANGESTRGLANELADRGLTTGGGFTWSASAVRRVARNLAYCAIRVHGTDEHPAMWPPIVSESLLRSARARTDANAISHPMPSTTAVHLLSGIVRCGKCGARMFRGHDRNNIHVYVCRTRNWVDPETGRQYGLGHLTVRKEPVDIIVTEAVNSYLNRPDIATLIAAATVTTDDPATATAAGLRARLDEAVGEFTAGRLSAATLGKIEADMLPKIEAAEHAARRATFSPAVADAIGHDFGSLPMRTQREIIATICTVTIRPGGAGRVFDPTRVQITWKV